MEAAEGFLRELGFAFIIAWMISVGIETHARNEDGRRADELRKSIAVDVFKGVFSHRLPRPYIDRVVELHLYPVIIREELRLKLELRRLSGEECDRWRLPRDHFVIVTQTAFFTLRNTSTGRYRHTLGLMIPSHHGVRSEIARGQSVVIRGEELTDDAIEMARTDGGDGSSKTYAWQLEFERDELMQIEFKSQLLKETSDTEVWASFLPTMRAEFEIEDHAGGHWLGIRSTGPSLEDIEPKDHPSRRRWKVDAPILKNESVVMWWRAAVEDGIPESSPSDPALRT